MDYDGDYNILPLDDESGYRSKFSFCLTEEGEEVEDHEGYVGLEGVRVKFGIMSFLVFY